MPTCCACGHDQPFYSHHTAYRDQSPYVRQPPLMNELVILKFRHGHLQDGASPDWKHRKDCKTISESSKTLCCYVLVSFARPVTMVTLSRTLPDSVIMPLARLLCTSRDAHDTTLLCHEALAPKPGGRFSRCATAAQASCCPSSPGCIRKDYTHSNSNLHTKTT